MFKDMDYKLPEDSILSSKNRKVLVGVVATSTASGIFLALSTFFWITKLM